MRRVPQAVVFIVSLLILVPCLAQSNIFNNGGFEQGLMGYQYWMWSITGIDFRGDYRFALSSDSHSGAYSAEIYCLPGGTDCSRASIYTNLIPTTGGQAYKLSVYAKCPTGTYNYVVAVDQIGSGVPGSLRQLTCNGSWALNQVAFQVLPTTNLFRIYFTNNAKSWLLIDDVVLTYADGTAPPNTILHPGVRSVSVSGQTVMVDGAPYLALGFFDVPYSDLAAAKSLGANTVLGLNNYNSADDFNTGQKSYLDHAYELGLNFLPGSSSTAAVREPAVFPSITRTFAPHLANIAWFLADEPDLAEVPWLYIPPLTLIGESHNAKTQTTLPMMSDLQRASYGTTADISPYAPALDIFMGEPYGPDFTRVTHTINLFNSVQAKPIWLAQDGPDARLIVPKAYWAIVSGATGIFYFNWDGFHSQPAKLSAAQQAFTELQGLQGAIFGTKIDSLVTASPGVTTMSRLAQGTEYILAVNPSAQTVGVTFTVQGLPAGRPVNVLHEGCTITSTAGGFTDTFAGVSRHVYAISGKMTPVITWNNPPDMIFGGALSSSQLNAKANVPGSFSYNPPAGTVLPVGSNQALSTQFTPSDTATYNNTSASVRINVIASPGPATLVLTRMLARDSNTNQVVVTLTIANTAGSAATRVQATSAKIGATATTTPLPQSVPDIPGGGSRSTTLRFPGSVGNPGAAAILSISGTYSGGSFGGSFRIALP
jgi:hypothetical protein